LGLPPALDALPFADRMADTVGLLGLEDLAGRVGLRVVALAGFGFRAGIRFFFAAGSLRATTFLGADFFAGLLEEVDFFAIFLGANFLVERAINVIGGATFLSRPEYGEA
jgi:hypothetical protein